METTNISQRVAAISGAASGIGLALATLYARRGIRVIAGYYPDDPHDPTVAAAQVEEAGGDALWLPLNVADTASVDTFITQGVAHYGRLDYVIANAGIGMLPVHLSGPALAAGELWQLPPYEDLPVTETFRITNPDSALNPAERAFLVHVAEVPPWRWGEKHQSD